MTVTELTMHKPFSAHTATADGAAGVEAAGHTARGVEAAARRTPRLAGHPAVTAVRSAGGRLVVLEPKVAG